MSQPREPRGQVRFREREAARLTRAIRQAGGGKMTLDPATGLYTIEIAGDDVDDDNADPTDWESEIKSLQEKQP